MRKLFSWVLILCMLCSLLPKAAVAVHAEENSNLISGTYGDNLTWTLDPETGLLTLNGTGSMKSYTFSSQIPWKSYLNSIKKAVIEEGITNIAQYAFQNCTTLEEISIPETVTSIGNSAFYGCSSLRSITLPASLSYISDNVFANCTSLTAIWVDDENKSFSSDENGILYNKSGTYLRQCPGSYEGEFVIPETVTGISSYAFRGCTGLTGVSIPPSVTTLGTYAFANCPNLTKLYIPEGVKSISSNLCYESSNLSEISIPSTVKTIGNNAFYKCSGLTQIQLPESVTTIGSSAFYGCSGLTTMTIPAGVTQIESRTFYNCSGLLSLIIPESVKSIGSYAFYGCSGLTGLSLPAGMEKVSDYAFAYCSGLSTAALPEGVTTIGKYAFSNCAGLTSVSIPMGVTDIGEFAFSNCNGLTAVTISESVSAIGTRAFTNCPMLTGIWVAEANPYFSNDEKGVLFNKDQSLLIQCPGGYTGAYVIAEGVTDIADYAFYYCKNLSEVSIGDNVIGFGSYAFSNCTGLVKVVIGDSVEKIGNHAFYYCSSLTDVTYGASVTEIGEHAFYQCISLPSVVIPDTVLHIGSLSFAYCDKLNSLTLGNNVKTIGGSAFLHRNRIPSVTIPASVESLPASAFFDCDSLTGVWVDENNPYYSSDENGALYNKDKTELIYYPAGRRGSYTVPDSVTRIGDQAFYYGSGVSHVTIPDTVTYLGETAFGYCTSINTIDIGSGIKEFKWGTFFNCGLDEVTIPDTVEKIGGAAFYMCFGLKTIHIGDGVTSIGGSAFYWCNSLVDISVGKNVSNISSYAFYDCKKLRQVHFLGDMPTMHQDAFLKCTEELTFCYPKDAEGWENCEYNTVPIEYTYVNRGADHTIDCVHCNYFVPEEHTYIDNLCVCGAKWDPIDEPQLIFSSKTLSLRDYICFDFTVHNSVLEHYDSWFVIFERYDHELDTVVTTRVESEDFFNHQLLEIKLCSYQMADPFTATLYAVKDGTPYRGEVYTNSVAGYVNENIVNATSDAHRTLFANLVTYGAKAQIYMNYNTENLADAGLGEYASYVTTTIPTAETVFSETNNGRKGVTLTRTALGIASSVELQLALNVSDEYNANKIYAEMVYTGSNGQTVTERVEGSDFLDYGIFYVCIFRSLTAVDGRTPVEITVYDQSGNAVSETWTYSIVSYQYNSPLTGAALDTLHALINYFDSAEVYFSGVQQVEAT